MTKMPSTLGERAVPRATRRVTTYDPSQGLGFARRGTAAIGAGLDDISKGLTQTAAALYEENLKDEERAVKNLEVEWSKKRREILFGDGTPNKPGFFSTAGEDTINARGGVEAELNKARSQILGKAKSQRVKEVFDLSSANSLQGELEQVDRYTIGQRREANTLASKASIDEAMQSAATYFSDDKKWAGAVERISYEVASMGDNEGWSQELINNTTQKYISQAAKDRVSRALLTDAKAGEALYMKSRDMIDGDMRIQIEQDIQAAKKAEEVDRRLAAAEARAAAADLDKAAFGEWASKIVGGESVSPKDIALDGRMDGQSKLALANALETKASRAPAKDYGLFNEYFARIHLPDGDPRKITDWHALIPIQAQLGDFSLFEQLRQEVEKQGTEEGQMQGKYLTQTLSQAKNVLSGTNELLGMRDPKGEELLQRATVAIMSAWDAGIKAGKNPADLANPDHPDYVGKVINNLRRPMDVMMKDIFDATKGIDLGTDAATPGAASQQTDIPVLTEEEWAKAPVGTKYRKEGDPVTTIRTKR